LTQKKTAGLIILTFKTQRILWCLIGIKKAFGSEHSKYKEEELDKIAELIKPRLEDLNDIFNTSRFFFIKPKEYPEKQVKKLKKTGFNEVIESLVSIVEKSGDLNNLKPLVEALVKEKEWGFGKVLGLFRLSIVGELSGPDLFEVVSIIGKQEVLERLHTLKDHLNKVNL
jgi:glutamyl-tRNA synthetase